jgi:hypothetical protein
VPATCRWRFDRDRIDAVLQRPTTPEMQLLGDEIRDMQAVRAPI